ncbi:MAG: hypothetical protein IKQ17_10425 [Kiritimatiellae bacterium]|nr:hypothetical protein [Kiritimatiellia bacterium]
MTRTVRFTCKDRLVSFDGVWAKIPCGKVEVWAEMTQPNHGHCIRRVFRTFWKMRPFAPGAYPKPPRTYAEASRLCYEYVYGLPSLGKFLETCCHGV